MEVRFKDSIGFKLIMPIIYGIVVVSAIAIISLYFYEKNKLENRIENDALALTANLHLSAKDSIAKGQRQSFQAVLDNFTTIGGVKSAYLYNSGGFMTYLSGYKTVGKPFLMQDGKIVNPNKVLYKATNGAYMRDDWNYNDLHHSVASKAHRMQNQGNCKNCHITINPKNYQQFSFQNNQSKTLLPLVASKECITCHTNWTPGRVAGFVGLTIDHTKIISNMKQTIFEFLIALLFVGIVSIVIAFIITKKSLKPLEIFQNGLFDFFKFLNNEIEDTNPININSKDEIGVMTKVINNNITKTKTLIEQDRVVINEVQKAVNIAKNGKMNYIITSKTTNQSLEQLKDGFNELLQVVNTKVASDLNDIQKALQYFQQLNFTHKINDNGEVSIGLNSLANTIVDMLNQNKQNGLVLEQSANTLLTNVQLLSSASNSAAASLEETSAALEEMTGNVSSSTSNIMQMANLGNDVKGYVIQGRDLAHKTTSSMDEINEQVASINEAITVIDQIAFQTNILSLNAAVEAATAGEAGKGFAVVAQEVRNLANRSADAAKEIKKLVEQATDKANDGKDISNKMLSDYSLLDESITKTLELIEDVETASKEQLQGIEQINDAVTQLDKATQENAAEANSVAQIAQDVSHMAEELVADASAKKFN